MADMLWIDHFGNGSVVACFSGRDGGVSQAPYASKNLGLHVGDDPRAVLENRRKVARRLDTTPDRITYAAQVHGSGAALVLRKDVGRGAQELQDAVPAVDALVTRVRGAALAVLAADCAPLLLTDADAGVVAAVHAGWRGATQGVVLTALHSMVEQGARPERVRVALGPAIRGCCYEIDAPVVKAVRKAVGQFAPACRAPLTPSENGRDRSMLDIPALCRDQLVSAGVEARQIVDVGICTQCMPGYFSHRRDGGKTGRHGGFIGLV